MDLFEKATIIHYHRHRIGQYAHGTVKSLGWKGQASQTRRFEALAQIGNLNGCSLLDVGCGYGDLKAFLDKRFSGFTYLGIDQMPEFIAEAKRRYQHTADTFFYQADFTTVDLPSVDYVFACGSLIYRSRNPDFYLRMIGKLYAAAGRACAFNMLDAALFPRHELLVGHHLAEIVAGCEGIAASVEVVRGYLADDFTVFMYRDPTDGKIEEA